MVQRLLEHPMSGIEEAKLAVGVEQRDAGAEEAELNGERAKGWSEAVVVPEAEGTFPEHVTEEGDGVGGAALGGGERAHHNGPGDGATEAGRGGEEEAVRLGEFAGPGVAGEHAVEAWREKALLLWGAIRSNSTRACANRPEEMSYWRCRLSHWVAGSKPILIIRVLRRRRRGHRGRR
jgi:hypothetical protein